MRMLMLLCKTWEEGTERDMVVKGTRGGWLKLGTWACCALQAPRLSTTGHAA
jgi:hypothetical protein